MIPGQPSKASVRKGTQPAGLPAGLRVEQRKRIRFNCLLQSRRSVVTDIATGQLASGVGESHRQVELQAWLNLVRISHVECIRRIRIVKTLEAGIAAGISGAPCLTSARLPVIRNCP